MYNECSYPPPEAHIKDDIISIAALGRTWKIVRHEDMEELWEQLDEADFADERIPYWAELWPASLGLAQWLMLARSELQGRRCLDFGCGLGFTALVGQWLGARMLACDYEQAALRSAQESAALCGVVRPGFFCMDWRQPALAMASIYRAWAADVIYEERSMEPVLNMLAECLGKDGVAWLADPGRAIFRKFINLCESRGYVLQPVFKIDIIPPLRLEVCNHITIWELKLD